LQNQVKVRVRGKGKEVNLKIEDVSERSSNSMRKFLDWVQKSIIQEGKGSNLKIRGTNLKGKVKKVLDLRFNPNLKIGG